MKSRKIFINPLPQFDVPRRSESRRGRLPASAMLDVARCPLCRASLVPRMGRTGPRFHCRCKGPLIKMELASH